MGKKLTQEEVIKRILIANKNVDLSIFKYINSTTISIFICTLCNKPYTQIPKSAMKGIKCFNCFGNKKSTKEEFIKKVYKIYGDKIDCSFVEYINNLTPTKFRCTVCKKFFNKKPNVLLQGNGCFNCSKTRKLTQEEFIKSVYKIHGDKVDCSHDNYINSKEEYNFKCNVCNNFYKQRPNDCLNGHGCYFCGGTKKLTQEEFIRKIYNIHRDKVDCSYDTYINCKTEYNFKCNICNDFYKQPPSYSLQGVGCPNCDSPKGEKTIQEFLKNNNIKFEQQYKFKDCKNKKSLPFDFYLIEHNILIEIDGIQHFKPISFGSKKISKELLFQKIKINDNIKNEYCKLNNIILIRIPYLDGDTNKIIEILNTELQKLNII